MMQNRWHQPDPWRGNHHLVQQVLLLLLLVLAALILASTALAGHALAQEVFSSGDQPGGGAPDGGPGGGDVFNANPDYGSSNPGDCVGINVIFNAGRCNPRPLPSYTGCGPYYNNYQYFLKSTLQHLGGLCEVRAGGVLWCPQRKAGMCNPDAGSMPGLPLVDTGIRYDRQCQSHCDFTVAQGPGNLQGTVSMTEPGQADPATDCTPPGSPTDQQNAQAIAQAAHRLAVNTVMGVGSFLEGSAKVIDDYAQFLAQPRGVPATKIATGIMQAGRAVAAFWSNKDPHKHQALLAAAKRAVDTFRQNPAYNSGTIAGNLLVGYGTGGACQLTGKAVTAMGQRVLQAGTALNRLQRVEQAGEEFAKAVGENGVGGGGGGAGAGSAAGGTEAGAEGAGGSYGQNNGGQQGGVGQQGGGSPINDRNLNTNCVQCTIAGLKRLMGQGKPTASDVFVHPTDEVLESPQVFKLLADHFGKTPPAYLDAEQMAQFSQGVPFQFPNLDALEARLAGIARNGTAGPGVSPKVVIFIENQPAFSAINGTGKLNPNPLFPSSAPPLPTPPGHVIAGVGEVNGMKLMDFQSGLANNDLLQQMFMEPWHPTAAPPKILVYPVQ